MTLKRLAMYSLAVTASLAFFCQAAEGAKIFGTLTNTSGYPINGDRNPITIRVYKGNPCESPIYAGQSSVGSTGSFSIGSLPVGSYYVKAINENGSAYLDEWWASPSGSSLCSGAQEVALAATTSQKQANFVMDQGGMISGKVYQSNGTTALTGVSIQVDAVMGTPCGAPVVKRYASTTSSNGSYTILGLPQGTYYVRTSTGYNAGYIDEWWASAASTPDCSGAETVVINAMGQEISGRNFQLGLGGSISGTVYQGNGTTPVTGVKIFVMLYKGGSCDTQAPNDFKGYVPTDENNGSYSFKGLPMGTYYLWAHNMHGSDYLNEWWASPKSTDFCEDRQAVEINTPGQAFSGRNFQLEQGGSISGTVYQNDGQTPVTEDRLLIRAALGSPCDPYLFPTEWAYFGWAVTNPDGTYTLRGLPLTSFYLVSENGGASHWVNEWWASPESTVQCSVAQPVVISTSGQAVSGKNFKLDRGASISGTVYRSDGTTPLTGGSIQIWAVSDSSCTGSVMKKVLTNPANGTFSFTDLPLGTYYLWSYNMELAYFTNEWWASSESVSDCGQAEPVKVEAPGQEFTGKNFQLDIGATLSGTVYREDGTTPVTGEPILLTLYKGDPCGEKQWMNDTGIDQDNGTYVLLGLAPGTYYLQATNQNLSDYANSWYASPKSSRECTGAQPIEITDLSDLVEGRDFQLKQGGSISGTVYQSDGTTPLTGYSIQIEAVIGSPCGAFISVMNTRTDPTTGAYTMRGLPLTTYSLISGNMQLSDHVNEWWASPSSSPLCGSAQTVPLTTEGEAVTGRNFQLEPGGRISGRVLGDEGPIGKASVEIYAGSCGRDYLTATYVDEDGHYTTPALPPGDVYVRATGASHSNYIERHYDGGEGATDLECGLADPVQVVAGSTTPAIDFYLEQGDKRVNLNQVVVFNGELFTSFGVNPAFGDQVASATLKMPNPGRGVNGLYVFNLEEDDLLISSECAYLAYWSRRFGPVAAADYGSYTFTVSFEDGVEEIFRWELGAATVVPASNIAVAVDDDGSALVTWERNTSNPYYYQVRVSDGTQEIHRSGYSENKEEMEISAGDLRCLAIGRTHRWEVRVYDSNPLTLAYNRVESAEVEAPYAPLNLNVRVSTAGVYKYDGTLTLDFDVRPGSRDYVKAACVTGPAGFSYCFDIDKDYTDLSTETRIYKGWFKQNPAWPIADGTYTFTIDYDDDLNGTTDHTEVVTRSLSADTYPPVEDITMHNFVWPDGTLDFGWNLSGISGLYYEVVIGSPDGPEEYFSSGFYTNSAFVSIPVYRLRAMTRGGTYRWFVRSWSADTDTMEQSPSQEFIYDPAPVHDATKATFHANSATINNPYLPFRKGDKLIYTGTGALKDYRRYWEALDVEVVDGVQCLKLVIKGNGNNLLPDLDSDWTSMWLAQDADGNVWLLQLHENLTGQTLFSGRSQAVLWMPATPMVGTVFRQMTDEFTQIEKTGLEMILGSGLGPYNNSVRLYRSDFTTIELQYLVPNVGLVVEEYNEGLSGWQLQQIMRAESPKSELMLSFPGYGLYRYDLRGGYEHLKPVNPSQMVTLDLNGSGTDALVAAFPDSSLYTYDSVNEWQLINTVDPEKMIAADIDGDGKDELVAGFIGYGLYYYDDPGIWSAAPINTILPDAMIRHSDGVVCDFGAAHGLWSYNTSGGWLQVNTVDPDKMVAADIDGDGKDELVVSFVGYGLYTYKPEGKIWQQINTVIPDKMLAVDLDGDRKEELVISFAGYGLYTYEPEGQIWQPINTVIPDEMIRQGNGIAVDFGAAYGLWVWSREGGWQRRDPADPGQMTVLDIDHDGVEELVVSFGVYGLYWFDETNDWQFLNDVLPDGMKPIKFNP